ncbi:hypothetical protein JHD50_12250 [Sulfurimonas sp. MAG313]|nr:hypothetical protein [Sulfurimonas sp. MAG313]MDF1882060.1 hypothetical protein [Sulfurimonas sp. MAG313]
MARRGSGLFSVGTLLASFFGAGMIAIAFAYFNYKFQEYKFIDFNKWLVYKKADVFTPDEEKYLVVFYSSKKAGVVENLNKLRPKYKILAIDYYQKDFASTKNVVHVRSGTDTILKIIQRFNIYKTPSVFIIKKVKEGLYKQDSMIAELDTINEIPDTL